MFATKRAGAGSDIELKRSKVNLAQDLEAGEGQAPGERSGKTLMIVPSLERQVL